MAATPKPVKKEKKVHPKIAKKQEKREAKLTGVKHEGKQTEFQKLQMGYKKIGKRGKTSEKIKKKKQVDYIDKHNLHGAPL